MVIEIYSPKIFKGIQSFSAKARFQNLKKACEIPIRDKSLGK